MSTFDEIIKSKVEAHTPTPDPAMWNSISNSLPPANNSVAMPWKAIGGVLLAGAIGTGAVLGYQNLRPTDYTQRTEAIETITTDQSELNVNEFAPLSENERSALLEQQNEPVEEVAPVTIESEEAAKEVVENESELVVEQVNAEPKQPEEKQPKPTKEVQPTNLIASLATSQNQFCDGDDVTATTNEKAHWYINGKRKTRRTASEFTFKAKEGATISAKAKGQETVVNYNVLPAPNADFSSDAELQTQLRAELFGGKCQWLLDGKVQKNGPSVTHNWVNPGKHTVRLTTTDDNGCSGTTTKSIEVVDDFKFYPAEQITLSGLQENRIFMPTGLAGRDNLKFVLTIYDASGKTVYRTESAYAPWDGKVNGSGKTGGYSWTVKGAFDSGRTIEKAGKLQVLD